MLINESKAETLLRKDLQDAEEAVDRLVKVGINDNQFSALVSFTFNVGAGALEASTLFFYSILIRKLRQSLLNFCDGTKSAKKNCRD